MGHKVHPKGLRLGIIEGWDAKWYAGKKQYADLLLEDDKVRKHVFRKFAAAGVSRVEIERAANRVKVTVHTAKPGMVIGRGGAGADELRVELEKITGKQVSINIGEIKQPEIDAKLVAENIALALEKRISHRRAMKQAISRAIKAGAKGVRVAVAGRIGGAEIARRERSWEGTVPLHTLRANIDYGAADANTTYGKIGVKVWIYKGEVLPQKKAPVAAPEAAPEGEAGE